MKTPKEILQGRVQKDIEWKERTRNALETHIDSQLESYFDGELAVVERLKTNHGESFHTNAVDELFEDYRQIGWLVFWGDNQWLFMPSSRTPEQIETVKAKSGVSLWRGQ